MVHVHLKFYTFCSFLYANEGARRCGTLHCESADVGAITACGVGDRGIVEGARKTSAAPVGGQTASLTITRPFVDGRAGEII